MLDLQTCIHLQEVEILLLIHQELNRAGVRVSRRLSHADCRLPHSTPHIGVDDRGRRLLDYLLVAALQRAFPLSQVNSIPVLVREHLHLNVARIHDRLLKVNFTVAKGTLRLAPRSFQCGLKLIWRMHQPHPLTSATRGGFQHHRIPDTLGNGLRLLE